MRPRPTAATAASAPPFRRCRWWLSELPSYLQIRLHVREQALAHVGARQPEGDVGAQESGLRTAIMPLAFELDAVKTLRPRQSDHGVGELDLAARAALMPLQDLEDLRLQDVAPGDREVRRRAALRWLLHHAFDLEQAPLTLADAADAVLMGQMVRHLLYREQVRLVRQHLRRRDHLREAARRVQHQLIRQHHRERLVTYDVARAPDRMAEAERGLLAGKAHRASLGLVARQNLLLGLLAARGQRRVELVHAIEMILDHTLVAAGHEDEMLDAGLLGLVDDILDQRLVDDGQHFLRHGLGGRKNTGAEAGDRKDGFADFHGTDRAT